MKPETKALLEAAQLEKFGFLNETDVAAIASDPETRLTLLLVRCGGGRFLTPAQDVKHFIALVESGIDPDAGNNSDYVRDVSLPADFKIDGDKPKPLTAEARSLISLHQHLHRIHEFDERHCSGAFDGTNVISDAEGGL